MNPILDLNALRHKLRGVDLTPARRQLLQRELADRTTPADRAELDALLRRLPANETAEIRDLLFRLSRRWVEWRWVESCRWVMGMSPRRSGVTRRSGVAGDSPGSPVARRFPLEFMRADRITAPPFVCYEVRRRCPPALSWPALPASGGEIIDTACVRWP